MAEVVTTVADVVNLALGRIGYRLRVADLLDGSEASTVALDIYGQERDNLLREGNWGFAQRQVNGTVLKSAPTNYFDTPWSPADNPPMPWQFSYEYPADCLEVRSVRPRPGFLVVVDPQPTLFNVVNDAGYSPPRKVVVANTADAVLIYTAQVTNPAYWHVGFVEALAARLADRMKLRLADPRLASLLVQEDAAETGRAEATQG